MLYIGTCSCMLYIVVGSYIYMAIYRYMTILYGHMSIYIYIQWDYIAYNMSEGYSWGIPPHQVIKS